MTRPVFEEIPATQLVIDMVYQRELSVPRVRKIAAAFDEAMLQPLEVSRRLDGTLAVIDGQTRRAAAIIAKGDEFLLPCRVQEGLTVADEARLFDEYQRAGKRLSSLDQHKAALVYDDSIAHAVRRATEAVGLSVSAQHQEHGNVNAVDMCRVVVRHSGEETLRQTLSVLHTAWAGQNNCYAGFHISGLSYMLRTFGSTIQRDRLIKVMSRSTPNVWIGQAKAAYAGGAGGKTSPRGWVIVAEVEYNKNLRSGRIDLSKMYRQNDE